MIQKRCNEIASNLQNNFLSLVSFGTIMVQSKEILCGNIWQMFDFDLGEIEKSGKNQSTLKCFFKDKMVYDVTNLFIVVYASK